MALLLGVAAMVTLAPDTGPAVVPGPPPERPPIARRPEPSVRPLPVEELEDDPPPRVAREDEPVPPLDPDQVFEPGLRGVSMAAVSRREAYQACWDRYSGMIEGYGGNADFGGRLTLRITVSPEGQPSTEVLNGPNEPTFDDCMSGVLSDARFAPSGQAFTLMWPVPLRTD